MLLTYSVCTSPVQRFNSFPICCLERSEHRDVTWLRLMEGMRGKPAEDDIVLMAELHDLEEFMSFESINDQNSRPAISK